MRTKKTWNKSPADLRQQTSDRATFSLFMGQMPGLRASVASCVLVFGLIFAPSLAPAHEITVGVIAGITRLGSSYGKDIVRGAKMAVREINAQGGINGRKIILKIVDDASDPARSAIAMRHLVSANVDLIVGGWGSSQVLANMDIAEQAGLPYIVVGATSPRITSRENKWTFRVIQTDDVMAAQLAHVATARLGLKRIAIISDNNAYGRGNQDIFVAALAKEGFEPVDVQAYQTPPKDFREQLGHILASSPDGLAIFGTLPAAPAIMNQARELGITARFLGTGGLENDDIMTLAPSSSEGTVLIGLFDENADAGAQSWSRRYKQEFADEKRPPRPVLAIWQYLFAERWMFRTGKFCETII